ncbi:MAG: hypothetical protein WCF10_19930 [Polyangiales bacterium]
MRRIANRLLLLSVAAFCLGASDCYTGTYVGYGYGYGPGYGPAYGPGYYNDVFYTPPIDRYGYGYGFYGRP